MIAAHMTLAIMEATTPIEAAMGRIPPRLKVAIDGMGTSGAISTTMTNSRASLLGPSQSIRIPD